MAVQEVPTEVSGGEPVEVHELTASREEALFTIALEYFSGHTNAAIRIEA